MSVIKEDAVHGHKQSLSVLKNLLKILSGRNSKAILRMIEVKKEILGSGNFRVIFYVQEKGDE